MTSRRYLPAALASPLGPAARAAPHFDSEPLDFLIERGKRNLKALGRLRLIPTGALQHVRNDAALHFLDNLEKGWPRVIRRQGASRAHQATAA